MTHFISEWRKKVSKNTYAELGNMVINPDLKQLMDNSTRNLIETYPNILNVCYTNDISSFYIDYPNTNRHGLSHNDVESYFAHFYKKVQLFQTYANLPFGKQFLEEYSKYFQIGSDCPLSQELGELIVKRMTDRRVGIKCSIHTVSKKNHYNSFNGAELREWLKLQISNDSILADFNPKTLGQELLSRRLIISCNRNKFLFEDSVNDIYKIFIKF